MSQRRAEGSPCEPEAADEAETDPAGAEVALEHGDLREIPRRVGDGEPVLDTRLVHERLRHDLALDEPDHACVPALPRDPEDVRRHRADADRGRTHSGTATEAISRPVSALEHQLRHERDEIRKEEHVGVITRRDRAEM